MRVPRKSKTRSSKCLPPDLKSSRWVTMSLSIHSMESSMKFNLREKIEDAKVVRKILRSLSESF